MTVVKKLKLKTAEKNKLRKLLPLLKVLSETKNPEETKSVLSNMNNSSFKNICECVYNAMYSNMLGTEKRQEFRNQFGDQKQSILQMVEPGLNFKNRKQVCCVNCDCIKFLISECCE